MASFLSPSQMFFLVHHAWSFFQQLLMQMLWVADHRSKPLPPAVHFFVSEIEISVNWISLVISQLFSLLLYFQAV